MLEIKLSWQVKEDSAGEKVTFFTLKSLKDNVPYCMSISSYGEDDALNILQAADLMVECVIKEAYPELKDPVYQTKARLKCLEQEKNILLKMIGEVENK